MYWGASVIPFIWEPNGSFQRSTSCLLFFFWLLKILKMLDGRELGGISGESEDRHRL